MTPTERVEKDVLKYIDVVYFISRTHRLSLRITQQGLEDNDVLNVALYFFTTVEEALEMTVMISLSKLYEGRGSRNLMKLVNFALANRKDIDWKHEPVTTEDMEEHKQLIEEQEDIVGKVISRRNEFYAHHDKDYFLDADELPDDYPISLDEVEQLIETAKKVVGDYYEAMEGRDINSMEQLLGEMDASRIFQALGEFHLNGDYTLATSG